MPRPRTRVTETRVYWTRSRARAAQSTEPPPSVPTTPPIPKPTSAQQPVPSPVEAPIIRPPFLPPHIEPPEKPFDYYSSSESHSSESEPWEDYELRVYRHDLLQEAGEEAPSTDEAWARSLRSDLLSDTAIDDFIKSSEAGYEGNGDGSGRWTGIPDAPRDLSELYGPFSALISAIVSRFCGSNVPGSSREVWNSRALGYVHERYVETCPDISIKAAGPSFDIPEDGWEYVKGLGFENVSGLIDVELDEETSTDAEHLSQMAMYSRHMFFRQPNRNFVRSLVITQRRVRLVHIDRSGGFVTPFINFHDDPYTLVRMVYGISSLDERDLGLDTSVRWSRDPQTGERESGTLEVIDESGRTFVYDLDVDRVPYRRINLCGRGTTCWLATDPTTKQAVLIKEAWRESDKRPEAAFLSAAQGVRGVVQMFSSQDNVAATASYRPPSLQSGKGFTPRIKSRIAMECYGMSIHCFTSVKQAIAALRDAIIGHRALYLKSVLHRDISMRNILLSPDEGLNGVYGALVDLDMGIWTTTSLEDMLLERPTGTRRYQSVTVIRNHTLEKPLPHGYLDDLESFFYILAHLLLMYERPGVKDAEAVEEFARWEHENHDVASIAKRAFILPGPKEPSAWWGETCETLLEEFRAIFDRIIKKKSDIRDTRKLTFEQKLERLQEVEAPSEEVYQSVVRLFDKALADIEKESTASQPQKAPTPPPLPRPHSKRRLSDPPVARPPKRPRTATCRPKRAKVPDADALDRPPQLRRSLRSRRA